MRIMQSKLTISVIIPVYNAAPFLCHCVESVAKFPYVQEIILVDDGSTDGSGGICDNLAEAHPDLIRVLHQENRGVSAARNLGICVSHCKWLWFVDADDYVLHLEEEHVHIPEEAQFVVTGFVWDEFGNTQTYGATSKDVPYNLWRSWFLRRKVNEYGLFFTDGRKYAEDQEFILRYLIAVGRNTTAAIAAPCYYYTLRPGSAMTRKNKKWKHAIDLTLAMIAIAKDAASNKRISETWIWKELRRMMRNVWEIFKKQ